MTAQAGPRLLRRLSTALFLPALALGGCEDPETFVPQSEIGGPSGVIDGTLLYAGPPPCTENNAIVGNAILLAFDTRLLPPPEGLGTSAGSIGVIPGETLFAGIRSSLVFDPTGARKCPDASAAPVTVSASWTIAPLPAGNYQVRGFFDRDGDFDPAFSIANLPSAGDVGGGAIANATEALAGKPPIYREIGLGTLQDNGTRVIPPEGARTSGVAVTLGLVLPLERPVFYPSAVSDATPAANKDPRRVVMPSDFQLKAVGGDESSFIRITMSAGVAPDEIEAASVAPFFMPVKPQAGLFVAVQDVNRDGTYDSKDRLPDVPLPSLYPLSLFTRLADGQKLTSQPRPRVILQGVTLYKSLIDTGAIAPMDPDPMNPMPTMPFVSPAEPQIVVALRPATACIDPFDPSKPGVLVVSRETDSMGTAILSKPDLVKAGLQAQFGRPFEIVYGCLPEGQYAMNLVYPTGQAWTLPNEGGVCAPLEPQTGDGKKCQSATSARARLASQDAMLVIGPPGDPAYCKTHPTPAQCTAIAVTSQH